MSNLEDFLTASQIKFRQNEAGSKCTTLACGGNIKILAEPGSLEEVKALLLFLKNENLQYFILGAGSNLIIPDQGVKRIVIRLGRGFRYIKELSQQEGGECLFEVGGAMALMSLSRELSEKGYSGLEFAGGIPASLGGAVRMNAGAHGEDMAGVLKNVTVATQDGIVTELSSAELEFSYRHSKLPPGSLVLSAIISLKKGDAPLIAAKRREFLDYRKATQPLTLPSFGSVFKNPSTESSAGKLIEEAGLKGFASGGAKVSEMHANWIVNEDRQASSANVIEIISIIKKKVEEKSGHKLTEEVVCWEEFSH